MGRSLKERFEEKVMPEPMSGCWLWDGAGTHDGYGHMLIGGRQTHGGRLVKAHRIAYEIYRSKIPEGKLVLHKCDVKPCVNPDHLYLGNRADNTRDAVVRKRVATRKNGKWNYGDHAKNERHYRTKLTRAQIEEIARSPESGSVLGIRFGITRAHVCRIKNGWRWSGGSGIKP